jgi:hypothetical protein
VEWVLNDREPEDPNRAAALLVPGFAIPSV